jgi:hypothetical protein
MLLQSTPQLDGAFEYLKKVGGESLDQAAFEESAGVGVVVSVHGSFWVCADEGGGAGGL